MLLFNPPVMSDSLRHHGLQHTRPPCPSPSPEVCPMSCPLHWWCHPAISSFDTLFSFCPQSFSASGTFPVSQLFTSGVQNTGGSASMSIPSSEYAGVVCHSLLQWTAFCQKSPLWSVCLGWPYMAWLIASLNYASTFAMTRQWSMKGENDATDSI